MTLGDKIREAVRTQDARLAGRIADRLRFKWGLNYAQTWQVVHKSVPDLEPAEWDQLLYDADTLDSRAR